ncbi:hypothetical protein [Neotabrizicola sp. VNH66]|uniref:hypothetical protein n=1 Tax=Neotabrizicola sp. VNH66 TaxID=3400918 RepID=UPI003C0EA622
MFLTSQRARAVTVAEGRDRRLDTLRALGTEAAVFRGESAVFAGLADEVADPVTAFRAFVAAPRGTTTPRGKGPMMTTAPEDHAQPATEPAASPPPEPAPPAAVAPSQTAAAVMSPEAIRAEAAEVAQVCAQAARLGVQIDASDAVAKGVKPEALRAKVLADLAARSDAAGIIATAPAAGAKESPIVAAAKKSAAASR